MVKNESDILESTLRHIFEQRIDRVLVVDNMSTDATPELLNDLAETHPILVGHDEEPAYFQAEKMTFLSRWASRHGAKWVIPTDADEFWFADGALVGDFLRGCPHSIVRASIHNLFPIAENPNPKSLSDGPLRFDFAEHNLGKVALRGSQFLWLAMGNHDGQSPGSTGHGLRVAHLPWRSEKQLAQKVRQGSIALGKTHLSTGYGEHWRAAASKSDIQIQSMWCQLLEGQSAPDMGWAPKGPFAVTSGSWWKGTWPAQELDAAKADS